MIPKEYRVSGLQVALSVKHAQVSDVLVAFIFLSCIVSVVMLVMMQLIILSAHC